MPNHVTNKLIISGPADALSKLEQQVKVPDTDDAENAFSFNQVIPMPEVFRDLSAGTMLSFALWLASEHIYQTTVEQDPAVVAVRAMFRSDSTEMFERFCMYFKCKCETRQEVVEWAKVNQPELLAMGMRSIAGYMEHGAVGWYDWSLANWGTKWDCYEVSREMEDGQLIYVFDTAWSPPSPVVEKLMELFPGIGIEHRYFDEGHCFWGITVYSPNGGIMEYDSQERDRIPLCIELKGYDPAEEESDAEDEDIEEITVVGSSNILSI